MRFICFTLFIVIFVPHFCYSQETKEVWSEYTYYATESTSIEEAKNVALDRAKIQAIANTFGTQVSQNATSTVLTQNGQSDSRFYMVGTSDIRGEWIETLEQPTYSLRFESPVIIVNCRVKGRIREIMQPEIELEAKILKNGLTLDYESDNFKDGDDLYLYFRSSVSGNIVVYLVQNDTAYRLLPYKRSQEVEFSVKSGKEYVFFSKASYNADRETTDEYELFSDNEVDIAQILIIYTPKSIDDTNVNDKIYDEPLSTDKETFNKWLIKKRNKDKYSRVIMLPLTIKKL